MNANTAYYFATDLYIKPTEKRKFYFVFRYINTEFDIDRNFRFCLREDETLYILVYKIANEVNRTIKIKKGLKEKENEETKKQQEDSAENIPKRQVKFLQKGNTMNYNMTCLNFNNLNHEIEFKLVDKEYKVLINTPHIMNLLLPTAIFVGFPIFPSIFEATIVDLNVSTYAWSKSLDKIKWVEVGQEKTYTPNKDDLNYYLKLECIPQNKEKVGIKFEAVSDETVREFELICPFEKRHSYTNQKLTGKSFRVISYNILSDQYCKNGHSKGEYLHCPDYALNIDYRRQLVLKELKGYNADIICLQEVDYIKVFKSFLRTEMRNLKYVCFYDPKAGRPEGLGFFFNVDRFRDILCFPNKLSINLRLIRKEIITIGKELDKNRHMSKLRRYISENDAVYKRLIDQNTILQVFVLRAVKLEEILVVANTHLYFHSEAKHIRLLQIAICNIYIDSIIKQTKNKFPGVRISLLFCGDFNSDPTSGVYNFFTKGLVTKQAEDWRLKEDEIVDNITLNSSRKMDSACGTPKYTNYTESFKACLDYIFYETPNLEVLQVVPLISEEEMAENTALPSVVVPSDHVALVADLQFS